MTAPIQSLPTSVADQLKSLSSPGFQGMESRGGEINSFKDLLVESIEHVNNMQQDADSAVETLLTGGDINPAEVMTAIQKADMTFRMMQQIRNKLVEAYQEIKEVRI